MNNYSNCEARLLEFCDYEYDWNANESEPLSTAALSNAFILLEHLPNCGDNDWFVYPVAYKGGIIQFEYENNDIYIEIEVSGLRYEVWVYDNRDKVCVDDASFATTRKLLKFIDKFRGKM